MNQTITESGVVQADFSSRFNPMLVKELRQGLRTRVFTAAFVLIQLIMVFLSLLGTDAASEGSSMSDFNGFFWSALSFCLLVVMPLRGFSAIANEMRNGALETVMLTHLTAWKITYGKWLALFSQTVLICLSLMPYLVLRYFLGGTDILLEVLWFFTLILLSGLFTAISVGASSQRSVLLRVFMVGIPTYFIFGVIGDSLERYISSRALGSPFGALPNPVFFGTLCVIAVLFATYYALDMGATYIAPEAENRSARKRIIGLAIVMLSLGSMWLVEVPVFGLRVVWVILMLICIDALSERSTLIPSVYAPFLRRGRAGKVAALFLCPGWAHGIYFVLLCLPFPVLGTLMITKFKFEFDQIPVYAYLLAGLATLVLPAALIGLLMPSKRSLSLYYVTFAFIVAVSIMFGVMVEMEQKFSYSSFLPIVSVVVINKISNLHELMRNGPEIAFALVMLIFTSGLSVMVVCIQGARHFRKAQRVYREFEQTAPLKQEGENIRP